LSFLLPNIYNVKYFQVVFLSAVIFRLCGYAIAEAVSHWLPTAAAQCSRPDLATEIYGEKSGVGAGFLRVLRFPLPKTVHSTNFSIITITRGS
jgi:hypothetical protein